MTVNLCIHTGYLKEPASPYKRGNGEDLLFVTVYVRDDDTGEDQPHKYRVEDARLIKEYEPLLTPGRSLTVWSKSKMVPVKRHDVTRFETLAFVVRKMEFHSRAGMASRAAGVACDSDHRDDAGAGAAEQAASAPDTVGAVGVSESPLKRVLEHFSATEEGSGDTGVTGQPEPIGPAGGAPGERRALPAA